MLYTPNLSEAFPIHDSGSCTLFPADGAAGLPSHSRADRCKEEVVVTKEYDTCHLLENCLFVTKDKLGLKKGSAIAPELRGMAQQAASL